MATRFTAETRPVPSPAALLAPVGDEACLLDTKSGGYFMLNRVGSLVWHQLTAGESIGEVHQRLVVKFPTSGEVLWHDLQLFVEALDSHGLVSIETSADEHDQEGE